MPPSSPLTDEQRAEVTAIVNGIEKWEELVQEDPVELTKQVQAAELYENIVDNPWHLRDRFNDLKKQIPTQSFSAIRADYSIKLQTYRVARDMVVRERDKAYRDLNEKQRLIKSQAWQISAHFKKALQKDAQQKYEEHYRNAC